MEKYKTILEVSVAVFEEKRSRFIGSLAPVNNEEEAMQFIAKIKSENRESRHNVHAFVVKDNGISRFSDDGEPHGTAGKPMLDVIVGSGITNIAVVVTRYFGGVLLGTGGLVRAYSKSVQDVLAGAEVFKMVPSTVLNIVCDYTDHGKLVNLIGNCNGVISDTQFTEKVLVEFCLKTEDVDSFEKKLTETFSARLKFEIIQKKLTPFKEK